MIIPTAPFFRATHLQYLIVGDGRHRTGTTYLHKSSIFRYFFEQLCLHFNAKFLSFFPAI